MPVFLLLLTLAPLLSCDAPGPLAADRDPGELFGPAEEELIVVDAILIVGAPLPPVMLRRTEAPGVSYEAAAAGLTGAEVLIRRGDALFEYRADPAMPGRYLPPDSAPRVEPDRVYELQVASGDAPVVRARTLTPARARIEELVWLDDDLETELQQLRLFSEIGDEVYDAGENQLEYPVGVLIARLGVGGETGFYQFATFNLESSSPYLFDTDWIEEGDLEEEEDFELERDNTSPLFRAEGSELYVPWDGIYYAGRYKVRLYAVDRNWFDLVRTDNLDSERSAGEAGQSFQRPLFHVDNGIGLFASASVDSFGFFVRPEGSPACSGCECWGCEEASPGE